MHYDVARRRQTVGRQLHDEGNRLAAEHQAVEQKAGENSNADTGEVERKHDKTAIVWKEGGNEHTVDGKLGAAAHERCEHDVILRSRSLARVREAIIAGTLQPKPMIIGTKEEPERPILRSILSITKATRAM